MKKKIMSLSDCVQTICLSYILCIIKFMYCVLLVLCTRISTLYTSPSLFVFVLFIHVILVHKWYFYIPMTKMWPVHFYAVIILKRYIHVPFTSSTFPPVRSIFPSCTNFWTNTISNIISFLVAATEHWE